MYSNSKTVKTKYITQQKKINARDTANWKEILLT